jgi:Type II CAAX prenyl endopeptidase Rce1-like
MIKSSMIAVAWFAILVSSDILNVLVDLLFSMSSVPAASALWSDIARVAILGLLSVIISFQPDIRPIRGFLIALFAFSSGYLCVHLFKQSQYWIHFRASNLNYQWTMVNSLLQSVPTFFMLATAFSHGLTRESLFLTKGDLSVATKWRLFGSNTSWYTLTSVFSILVLCMTGGFLMMRLNTSYNHGFATTLIEALPVVILFPLLNAINEEVRYRTVLLAEAEYVVSGDVALVMTTVLFGLNHFNSFLGTSGPGGSFLAGFTYALGATFLGWIAGRSMLETRGVLAAWIIHASADLVIILGYILAT